MPDVKVTDKIEESEPKVEATEEQPKKSGGLLKTIIIFGVMQLILAAGAFATFKTIIKPRMAAAGEMKNGLKENKAAEIGSGEIFLVENIIVNPAGTNGTRYLSTSIGLEIEKNEKSAERMKELTPVIRDILIAIFSSKTLDELGSIEGKEIVRKEILERVNLASAPWHISKVYFVDYVLQ
jgi:flagellar FliL protein